MPEKDLPSFDSLDEPKAVPDHLHKAGTSTQTIDLSSLFDTNVSSSGTFDLSGVGSTSLGRLLDALPMPAILIDEGNRVVFSNHGCARLTSDYQNMSGVPFLHLVPKPSDLEKAQALADKTLALLARVFKTRKPLTAEAILEISRKRIWARLNLRAVRIGLERYVLVLIEDVTSEKRELEMNRRRDREAEELRRELETLVEMANSELTAVNVRLRNEVTEHLKTQRMLRAEKQKCEMMARQNELATAVVTPTGEFRSLDLGFQELSGYELYNVPNLTELMTGRLDDLDLRDASALVRLEVFSRMDDEGTAGAACTLTRRDAEKRDIHVRGLKLEDGNYFLTFADKDRRPTEPTE
ncbi:MAG: hypothetical protein RDU20_05425 [Desulfomonilaceae bacterium]|nr:hypothetical protein [Desulfomonilaceae bacterium]